MNSTSAGASRGSAGLRALYNQWKTRADGKLDPIKENLLATTLKVAGIADLVETQRKDCQELADRLAWLTERVLNRVQPGDGWNPATEDFVRTLRKYERCPGIVAACSNLIVQHNRSSRRISKEAGVWEGEGDRGD